MKMAGSTAGRVLQGYFRIEPFRGTARTARAIQPLQPGRPAPRPPRPELMPAGMRWAAAQPKPLPSASGVPRPELLPAKMRGRVGQPKPERGSGPAWSGVPRPELLPGMGPFRGSGPHRAAQARASHGTSTTPIPAGQLRVIGEGRPLEPGLRRTMESFFQADFSGVRVHQGPAAPAMGALAFTLGDELHFAPGLYNPTTREGVALLGHELTHVVQQRDGRVANPYGHGVAIVQDPVLEAEADRMGQQIAELMWSGSRIGQAMWDRKPEGQGPDRFERRNRLSLQKTTKNEHDDTSSNTVSTMDPFEWAWSVTQNNELTNPPPLGDVLIISESGPVKDRTGNQLSNVSSITRTYYAEPYGWFTKEKNLNTLDSTWLPWNWVDGDYPKEQAFDTIIARSMICACEDEHFDPPGPKEGKPISTCGGITPNDRGTVLERVLKLLRSGGRAVFTVSPQGGGVPGHVRTSARTKTLAYWQSILPPPPEGFRSVKLWIPGDGRGGEPAGEFFGFVIYRDK